jgi:uncharacterized membrane protein YphA (DoxX/SURF4 family)
MFPSGWPSVGLLVLRGALGATLMRVGGAYLSHASGAPIWAWAVGVLATASGLALVVGFLTPIAGVAAGVAGSGAALWWPPPGAPQALDGTLAAILVVAVAVALALLGPGALSLDARLFGRREIVIPPGSGRSGRE